MPLPPTSTKWRLPLESPRIRTGCSLSLREESTGIERVEEEDACLPRPRRDEAMDAAAAAAAAAATAFSAMQQVAAVMSILFISRWSLFFFPLVRTLPPVVDWLLVVEEEEEEEEEEPVGFCTTLLSKKLNRFHCRSMVVGVEVCLVGCFMDTLTLRVR